MNLQLAAIQRIDLCGGTPCRQTPTQPMHDLYFISFSL